MKSVKTLMRTDLLFVLLLFVSRLSGLVAAESDHVLLKFRSQVYEKAGSEDAAITFALFTDSKTTVTISTGSAEYTTEIDTATDGTFFQGLVGESGWVTIKGDPARLFGIDLSHGVYIDTIDFSGWKNIEQLNLSHNELQSLDLSELSALTYLNISDNPFDADKLVLGTDHPDLMILEMAMIDNFPAEGPKVENFPKLASYVAYSTHGYTSLDFSTCPDLLQVSIDNSDVTECELGAVNGKLQILNISNCAFTFEDFGVFPDLKQLYAGHSATSFKLKSIDVSQNPGLVYLFLEDNALTELDISHNPGLMTLCLSNNSLSRLDVSQNTYLYELLIRRNRFNFATLPYPSDSYINYEYTYQEDFPLKVKYKAGDTIDFSTSMLREGGVTSCSMYSLNPKDPTNPVELSAGVDYIFNENTGKAVLKRAQTYPVYFKFQNDLFLGEDGENAIYTSKFYLLSEADYDKPAYCFSMMPASKLSNLIVEVAKSDGSRFADETEIPPLYIDWGDGNLDKRTNRGATYILSKSGIAYKNVKFYLDRGYEVVGIFASDTLITIDLSELYDLQTLTLKNAGLSSIDLKWNGCLQGLDLSGNAISYLDLDGPEFSFAKRWLQNLIVPGNGLSTLTWTDEKESLLSVDLSSNHLTEVDFKSASKLISLNLGNNNLSEIDLSGNPELTAIMLQGNKLRELSLPNDTWQSLDISHNLFTFETMPKAQKSGYTYAPQPALQIPRKGSGVDLSKQIFSQPYVWYRNGQTAVTDTAETVIKWYKESDSALAPEDYTIDEKGYTTFNRPASLGKVYAVLSHEAYPAFSGNNAFRTTLIEAAEAPTKLIASFITTASTDQAAMMLAAEQEGGSLYVDWGDGNLQSYELPTIFPYETHKVSTVKDAEVKMYVYDDASPLTIFSVEGIPMRNADFSGFTSVKTLTLSACGLDSVNLSPLESLVELNLSDNRLSSIDLSHTPHIDMLGLSNNKLTTVDFSGCRQIGVLNLDKNNIAELDFSGMTRLWSLSLNHNRFEQIDLSPLTALYQVSLSGNLLSELNLDHNTDLRVLAITGNRFTFATLPRPREQWTVYTYHNQATMTPEVIHDCEIDLREQAFVEGTPTLFYWFDTPYEVDSEGYVITTPLVEGSDYAISEGYTKFLKSYDKVYGLMMNEVLPNINLEAVADYIKVPVANHSASAVEMPLKVYAKDGGIIVETLAGSDVEVFGIGGRREAYFRTDSSGRGQSRQLSRGVYIVRTAAGVAKVAVY